MNTMKLAPAVRPAPSARHARRWRLPVRPVGRVARVELIDGGVVAVGLAAIAAMPFRSTPEAIELANRVAADPASYLSLMLRLQMPGVTDLRSIRTAA